MKEQETKITELAKTQQDQLRQINLLFDEKAKDYETIDFNGLHSLLKGVVEREQSPTPNLQSETQRAEIMAKDKTIADLEKTIHQLRERLHKKGK